ncbi:MAG: hypothetical protein V3S32_07125, partial [Acidimicrobiia bacterium]
RYAVLKRLARKNGSARYLVLSTSGRVSTVGSREIPSASRRAGKLNLPTPFRPRDRRFVQEVLRRLRRVPPVTSDRSPQKRMLIEHPVAECPDAAHHLAAMRRSNRIRRCLSQHRALRRSSGFGLVEEFGAIRQLLEELDYTEGWSLTGRGERLRKIYNETDLLLAETVERGFLNGLEPPELASLLSAFVYEPRSNQASVPEWPTQELVGRWSDVETLWKDLNKSERALRLSPTRHPDPGFGNLAYLWASEMAFDDLPTHGMAPGDFVRVSRQLADLLRQIRDGVSELREEAIIALVSVDRGVVAAQGVG